MLHAIAKIVWLRRVAVALRWFLVERDAAYGMM